MALPRGLLPLLGGGRRARPVAARRALGAGAGARARRCAGLARRGAQAAPPSIALIVDADSAAVEAIDRLLEALGRRGRVQRTLLFAEPRRLENERWRAWVDSRGVQFFATSREGDPTGDPNDAAIFREARRLLSSPVDIIALLVQDKDFIELARDIVRAGKGCAVSSPRPQPGLMRQFQRAGAEIVEATGVDADDMKLARVLGILHADGSGSMEANTLGIVEELEYDSELLQMVSDRLQTLNYRSTHSDPMLPSIARFWFDNMLGELVAYPTLHAISSATDMLRKPRIQWNVGRGDLAFVFPVARRNKTASTISRYGNSSCAAKAKGGGPFIVNDSPYLAEEVLRRMGYMDDTRNADLDEAVDAFLGTTRNRRELRKIGIQIELSDTTQDKLAKIRHVCLSSSCTGELSVPPSDDAVRQFLAARGFIDSATSSDDIQGAMDAFVRKSGVSPKRSYNGLVGQCLDISTGRLEDPTRRP